jgi:glycosyltransferase involved in cell wall biosynthesis
MDAQAAGIPVVATRTGGIPEIVTDGVTGLLVPPRNPAILAAATERMLDDRSLRESCVGAARKQSERYDYRHTVYKTLDVYRQLCHKEHSPSERSRME